MIIKPTKRIIAKLDIKNGKLIKGINLEGLEFLVILMNLQNYIQIME